MSAKSGIVNFYNKEARAKNLKNGIFRATAERGGILQNDPISGNLWQICHLMHFEPTLYDFPVLRNRVGKNNNNNNNNNKE